MCVIQKQYIDKLNANDTHYLVSALCKSDGALVSEGELIAVLETSKTAVEIFAKYHGYIYFLHDLSENVAINGMFALFTDIYFSDKQELFIANGIMVLPSEVIDLPKNSPIISKYALKLVEHHQIDLSVFRNLQLVTKRDVLEYLKEQGITT